MTTTEAPPEPLMPTDVEIDGMDKRGLMTVCESHGLPVNDKMTAKELRPWARAVVHGARHAETPTEPEAGPEPVVSDAAPEVDVPLDTHAVDHADVIAELEPVRPRETVPAINVWERITMMADYLFKSSLRPATLKNVNDVGLVLLAAYDLGIPSSFAMQKIHVQNGRMGMMGELMSALILRDGHSLRADVANDRTSARVWGKRADDTDWTFADFTIEDAAAAGLVFRNDDGRYTARSSDGKPLPWELYTADMLYWRALARLARRHFSDCLGGISYTPDELGWAIDVETADELGGDAKPFGRAGEPEPTMTLGRARTEMGNRLAELPEDLQADIKERWKRARLHPVKDLTAAEMRTVRGWVEAAEEIAAQRDDTSHIPDADVVEGQDGGEPDPARSGDGEVEGSASLDRDAVEPSLADDRQDAGEPGPSDGPAGDDVAPTADGGEDRHVATSPAPDAERDPNKQYCAGCPEPIEDDQACVIADDGKAYHEECAPM